MGSSAGLGYKVGTAIILFFFTFIFAYLPFFISSFKTNKLLASLANCFAGGIFLCAGLLHIIPEAQESWEKATAVKPTPKELTHGSHEDGEAFPWIGFAIMSSFSVILLVDRVLLPGHHHPHEEHAHPHNDPQGIQKKLLDKGIEQKVHHSIDDQNDHSAIEVDHQTKDAPNIGPYMLVAAMGFHAFFEGLALGLLNDFSGFFGFLAAIMFHKWAEAAAIGLSFLLGNMKKMPTLISLTIFSLLTPMGVAAGIFFSDADDKIKAIMMAVSAGTFLYISIAEILSEEFTSQHKSGFKYLAFLIGMGLMVGVWFIEQLGNKSLHHDHNHDHQH